MYHQHWSEPRKYFNIHPQRGGSVGVLRRRVRWRVHPIRTGTHQQTKCTALATVRRCHLIDKSDRKHDSNNSSDCRATRQALRVFVEDDGRTIEKGEHAAGLQLVQFPTAGVIGGRGRVILLISARVMVFIGLAWNLTRINHQRDRQGSGWLDSLSLWGSGSGMKGINRLFSGLGFYWRIL